MKTDTKELMLDVLEVIEEFHDETYGCCMCSQHSLALYSILSYLWDIMATLAGCGEMTPEQREWFRLVREDQKNELD